MKKLLKLLHPRYQKLILDYPVEFKPRYGYGQPVHQQLNTIIAGQDKMYFEWLNEVKKNRDTLISWSLNKKNETEPHWNNQYLPGLDMVILYTIILKNKPQQYVEIGSGNSTKVVFSAKQNANLNTRIISIDPFPRAEIDNLSDEIIRQPFENINKDICAELNAGDILFIDNSHRVLPNSDATVFFMEILPRLKKGVIVQIHDIYLPFDYPQVMCDRFYSEQYTLAAYIMANPKKYKTMIPNYYLSQHSEYNATMDEFWGNLAPGIERHGGSYWIEITE